MAGFALANREIDFAAANFGIDQSVSLPAGTLALDAVNGGAATQTAGLIAAHNLVLPGAGGSYTLTDANLVGTVAGNTGSVTLFDALNLTIGSVTATGNGSASVAGSPYAIDIAAGSVTALNGYGFQFVSSGQLTVTARPTTVTADPQSRNLGDANPPLTFAVGGDGLVNGDTLSGALATDATSASPAGSFAITQGSLAASANYTLTFVGGVLTVEAPPSTSGPGAGLLTVGTSPSTGPDASLLTRISATGSEPVISGSDPASWGSVLDNGSSSQAVRLQDPRFANVLVCVATSQPSACTVTR